MFGWMFMGNSHTFQTMNSELCWEIVGPVIQFIDKVRAMSHMMYPELALRPAEMLHQEWQLLLHQVALNTCWLGLVTGDQNIDARSLRKHASVSKQPRAQPERLRQARGTGLLHCSYSLVHIPKEQWFFYFLLVETYWQRVKLGITK